jgi:hypothetical protein
MKTLILLLFPFVLFGQKPPKITFDSTKYSKDSVWDVYSAGVKLRATGLVRWDSDRNVIIGQNADVTGVQNFITLNMSFIRGHENTSFARNIIVENVSGTFSAGADHTFKQGSDYAAADGDAHVIGGYSSHTSGFGNWNFNAFGDVGGNSNVLGSLSKSSIIANRYTGGFIRGQGIKANGEVYAFGKNFSQDGDAIAFGYGSVKFKITPNGNLYLNGLLFPVDINPTVGSTLTVVSPGVLGWVTPSASKTVVGVYDAFGNAKYIRLK